MYQASNLHDLKTTRFITKIEELEKIYDFLN